MENLKPCPFCGSHKIDFYHNYIHCDKCESRGPEIYWLESEIDIELEAKKQWNTRTSGWISVDSALPEINTSVLVGSLGGGMEIGTYRKSGIWIAVFIPFGDDGVDNILDDVTHWMPLPDAPEVKL